MQVEAIIPARANNETINPTDWHIVTGILVTTFKNGFAVYTKDTKTASDCLSSTKGFYHQAPAHVTNREETWPMRDRLTLFILSFPGRLFASVGTKSHLLSILQGPHSLFTFEHSFH